MTAANEAILHLQTAQDKLDAARARVKANEGLANVLLADTDRMIADALTRMERIRRFMVLAKAKQVTGRWPQVATKQRDDVEDLTGTTVNLLSQVQNSLDKARSKMNTNPSLSEAIIADIANYQAKALTHTERITSLLIEAGIGRE